MTKQKKQKSPIIFIKQTRLVCVIKCVLRIPKKRIKNVTSFQSPFPFPTIFFRLRQRLQGRSMEVLALDFKVTPDGLEDGLNSRLKLVEMCVFF